MTQRIAALAILAILAAPVLVAAQDPGIRADTELELKRKRVLVRPEVSPEQVARDTARAIEEIERRDRQADLLRETQRPRRLARPDLDYDVRSGIQSRTLQRALQR